MRQLRDQETKLVALKHVVSRASKDKVFFRSLLKAPKATLKNNALKLSEADGKKLNTLIAKARRVKSQPVADLINNSKKLGIKPPRPFTPWMVLWPQ